MVAPTVAAASTATALRLALTTTATATTAATAGIAGTRQGPRGAWQRAGFASSSSSNTPLPTSPSPSRHPLQTDPKAKVGPSDGDEHEATTAAAATPTTDPTSSSTPPTSSEAFAQSYDLLSQQLALQREDSLLDSANSGTTTEEPEWSYDPVASQQRLIDGMAALHGRSSIGLDDLAQRLGGVGIESTHESSSIYASSCSFGEAGSSPSGLGGRTRRPRAASPRTSTPTSVPRRDFHLSPPRLARASTSQGSSSSSSIDLSFPQHAHPTPYDIFHLDPRASAQEIKRRYYDLVRHLHPDRRVGLAGATTGVSKGKNRLGGAMDPSPSTHGNSSSKAKEEALLTKANEEFKRVLAAYEILKDRSKREAYDRYGVGWGDSSGASGGLGGFAGTGMRPPPGWGGGSNGSGGGGTPRTKSEWEAYHAWSDMLRRTAAGAGHARTGWEYRGSSSKSHDSFGWQSYAANPDSSRAFYGFYTPNPGARGSGSGPEGANGGRQQPLYTSNLRFIGFLLLATWTVASIQYVRLSAQSARAVERADRKHLDAAKSLDEARELARSKEGRKRWEEMRRRARESKVLETLEAANGSKGGVEVGVGVGIEGETERGLLAIEGQSASSNTLTEENSWGIGHGGPSGRAAHEAREAERKRREDSRMGRA